MVIPHEQPTNANDPNRGMNVKLYLILVGAAIIVIAIILAIVIGTKSAKPAPVPQTTPTSRLARPGSPLSKPSPLHPTLVEASVHSTHSH